MLYNSVTHFAITLFTAFALTSCIVRTEESANKLLDPCAGEREGASCEMASDPGLVARCVNGACTPFGCDLCPRLPCQTIACDDGLCRQTAMDDGAQCTAFSDPLAPSGVVGRCEQGSCRGTVLCDGETSCPSVECVPTSCGSNGVCVGYAMPPGMACEYAPEQWGACFNFTCQPSND